MNDESNTRKQARESKRRKEEADNQLVRAYKQVFGREGNRSNAQKLVWASLMKQLMAPTSYKDLPTGQRMTFDERTATLNEGAREFIYELKRMVESSEPKQNKQGE